MSIANSPLVKTAIAGEDANWGRVVMAVGKAGEPADRDRLAISFGFSSLAVWALGPVVKAAGFDTLLMSLAVVATVTLFAVSFLPDSQPAPRTAAA